jgi:hypothetical protein
VTTRSLNPNPRNLIAGVLTVLLLTVLAGFGVLMLRVLNLNWLASLWFFSVFALGFVTAQAVTPKLEVRIKRYKSALVFAMLAMVLVVFAWRLKPDISVLEVGLYLLLSGFAFGTNLSIFQKRKPLNKRLMVLIGLCGVLVFGFLLTLMTSNHFAPQLEGIKNTLSIDERNQLEVFNLQTSLTGLNPSALKTQLKTNLSTQLERFGLALKNDNAAKQTLLEDPATPTHWRAILERGGIQAAAEELFLKQKNNLEKAFRDEDPSAIRALLSRGDMPAWARADLERGGLKDWVHRNFDRQRLTIEKAIQNSDQVAINVLLKSPQTPSGLRVLLKQGGVRVSIQKRLTNLRLALKKALETGDLDAVGLVYQHPFTPRSIREIFKNGALQPQIKLEITTNKNLLIEAFLKADREATKQLKLLGVPAKSNLPADFTVPQQATESRTQIAIKRLLETANQIRSEFLTRRTLFNRAIENGDANAIKTLCPDCEPAAQPSTASSTTTAVPRPATQTKTLENPKLPKSLKVYLQGGGLRASIKAKYTAQYQLVESAINSGDITRVLALLENPNIPAEVGSWITKLNLQDISSGETRAASLLKVKSIFEGLQQTQTKSAVLAALEVVNQTLDTFEVEELEGMIASQVVNNALGEALPTFDAAASKIETRAIDVALQGALIALTVNEKSAGNLAVQTLIDRAQTELAQKAPKTVKIILASSLKAANSDTQSIYQRLERVIDALIVVQKEAFVSALRKGFGILALVALLSAGFALTQSRLRALKGWTLES